MEFVSHEGKAEFNRRERRDGIFWPRITRILTNWSLAVAWILIAVGKLFIAFFL